MPKTFDQDSRIVMSLDAGGTNFKFSAMRENKPIIAPFSVPSHGDDLNACLETLIKGFERIQNEIPRRAAAISFAFPGPANYPAGVIGDLTNLSGFRGGVALGPMLREKFRMPVFINNDGDLFTYGEAIAGFLPYVNSLLEKAGSAKRYRNLFGITLGTGFGGGLVHNGELFLGDNICAAEIWTLRNKLSPMSCAEEGVSIRALKRIYASQAKVSVESAPDPKILFQISQGAAPGDQAAACEAFRQLGEVAGDALAQALTLVDGLAVIGGGISRAWPAFLPALMKELNSDFVQPNGSKARRLTQLAFNLQNAEEVPLFLKGNQKSICIPESDKTMFYDDQPRIGVGVSRLGTSEAVAIGAYAFALNKLDQEGSGT